MTAKRTLLTLCVALLLIVAGCSGAPVSDDSSPSSGDESDGGSIVTYTNQTENASFTLRANHDTETYDMRINATLEPPYDNLTRNYTVGALCEVLEDTAYNYTESNRTIAENESQYTKTTASGETETVHDLPDEIFTDYDPEDVRVVTYAENGTKLDTCTVEGKDEFSHERH